MPLIDLLQKLFSRSDSTQPSISERFMWAFRPKRKLAKPTVPVAAADQVSKAAKATPKRSVLDFVNGGPHAGVCRKVKKSDAKSILEIGVGDGSRALAVLKTLAKNRPDAHLKYIAIDLFELGDGDLTLKEFHQQVRAIDVKPTLIPMPIPQGLTRVAHTLGAVDLILVTDDQVDACDPLLARVTHDATVILKADGDSWQQIDRQSLIAGKGLEAA